MGSAYRRERLLTFFDPSRDPTGHGYQINQSYLALGGGGALGAGLGEGRQKLGFLPEPHTDFIFAMAGEELGLLGTLLLVGLFLLLLLKGMRLALRTDDPFGRLLAAGLTLMVVIPALLNMGVVTGLLPTKGLPLPLVSYGGSSLIVNLTAIGILYAISRQPRTGGIERERVKRGETEKRWR
jgi:cell division protein FtsW